LGTAHADYHGHDPTVSIGVVGDVLGPRGHLHHTRSQQLHL